MLEREDHGERVHRRISELIPWHVNGSLSEREREWVEAHLADCPRCQEEERTCRRTAEAVRSAGEGAPSPHPAQFRRLLGRIEETEREERGRSSRGGRLLARFRELIEATPRPLRGILVVQAAVILLFVGVLVWDAASADPAGVRNVYHTLSAEVPKVNSVPLRMMFRPDATEKEIRDLLHDVRGEIVGGPSAIGVYTVAVPAGTDPVKMLLARLRSEPQVMFVEPAAGEGAR
jgi:hypothetical protein